MSIVDRTVILNQSIKLGVIVNRREISEARALLAKLERVSSSNSNVLDYCDKITLKLKIAEESLEKDEINFIELKTGQVVCSPRAIMKEIHGLDESQRIIKRLRLSKIESIRKNSQSQVGKNARLIAALHLKLAESKAAIKLSKSE